MIPFRSRTPRPPAAFTRAAATAICLALTPLGTAQGTQGELIETLSKRGMHDLVDRLMELNPPTDPAERQLFAVAQARLRSDDADRRLRAAAEAGNTAVLPELTQAARDAFDQFLDEQRFLASDPSLADRRQRAMWKTDLAESLLFVWLRGRENYAAEFLEFGQPTRDQRVALYVGVEEALRQLVAAEDLLRQVQAFYGQNPQARRDDQASQLYYRLIEDYGQQRIPFYLAAALHTTALKPDDAPYFAQLGAATPLPGQRATPSEERTRLLREAAERLDTLLATDPGNVETPARSRLGRVLTQLGQAPQGIEEQLDPAIRAAAPGLDGLTPILGKAGALVSLKRFPQALETLDTTLRLDVLAGDPMLRLLVTDARFNTLQRRASTDPQKHAAYEVYADLLNDSALAAAAPGLRTLIYRRWTEPLPVGQSVADQPPTVRMAVGHSAREAGQRALLIDDNPDEARRHLRWAIAANETLTDAGLPDTLRASGLFNLGLAKVLLDDRNPATLIEAIEAWTEVADRYPQQPVALEAAQYAADYATVLVQQAPDHPRANAIYDQAMRVLFSRYDESEAATKHRLFYAFRVFQQQGQHERAAVEYARVPFGHPQYFEAQRLRLFNLQQLYEQTPAELTDPSSDRPMREARRRVAAGVAEQLAGDARRAIQQAGTTEQERPAGDAYGSAMAALASASADVGQIDEALSYLDEAGRTIGEAMIYDAARRDLLNRRILVLVGAQRYEAVADAAKTMMADFPDAAAAVVSGALGDLERQINALRSRAQDAGATQAAELEQQAGTLASVASRLAKLLLDWADGQGYDAAAMLAYELPYAKALRVAGRPDEALRFLEGRAVATAFPDDLAVLEAIGETRFALGVAMRREGNAEVYTLTDEAAARAAIPAFDRIITGLQPPFPESYWNAWLKRLAINVALGTEADKVPLRVRQLQAAHPDLGGPAFAERFARLVVQAQSRSNP